MVRAKHLDATRNTGQASKPTLDFWDHLNTIFVA
jgi:hypothetical protein